jgi:hypothetical protein
MAIFLSSPSSLLHLSYAFTQETMLLTVGVRSRCAAGGRGLQCAVRGHNADGPRPPFRRIWGGGDLSGQQGERISRRATTELE